MKFIDFYRTSRRYSYVITSVLIVIILAYFLLWKEFSLVGMLLTIGTSAAIFLLWIWLRPGETDVTDAKQVYEAIGNGHPTLLNIYSNY